MSEGDLTDEDDLPMGERSPDWFRAKWQQMVEKRRADRKRRALAEIRKLQPLVTEEQAQALAEQQVAASHGGT